MTTNNGVLARPLQASLLNPRSRRPVAETTLHPGVVILDTAAIPHEGEAIFSAKDGTVDLYRADAGALWAALREEGAA